MVSRYRSTCDASTSRSGQSTTGWPTACAPTCFCACSHITWNGTCATVWPPCSTTTPKRMRPKRCSSVVAKAERSASAITKQTTGRTEDGLPVHSFRTLLADLATFTRNTLVTALDPQHTLTLTARPTPLQQKAQDLLGLARTQ